MATSSQTSVVNMSAVLSPIGNGHANECPEPSPRGGSIHASTPVQCSMATCSLSEERQLELKPFSLSQTKISPLLDKIPVDKKKTSVKPLKDMQSAKQEISARLAKQLEPSTASLTDLKKLKEENKKTEETLDGSIISADHAKPYKSSQWISKESDDNMTSSEHLPALFDVFEEDGIYKSPFSEPPRRSYSRARPLKQLNLEEDELREEKQRPAKRSKSFNKRKERRRRPCVSSLGLREDKENEEQSPVKRNKTVNQRQKVMQTTLLDQWAKELSSHFAEVDETDLITE